ncbi:MAG: hypothetical protein IJY37_03170 [Clostridia bacterium]|nr:hypothetical protein [Clostridia bacterium]MBP3555019.1 hypothetical protein [Clostridia bacterium]MBQ8419346.1 hypothetical protein [Clostridia bacterium]
MNKKIGIIFIVFLLLCSCVITVGASDITEDIYIKYQPDVTVLPSVESRIPNTIGIEPTFNLDGTGIGVRIDNFGVDGLDSVTITVNATGYTTPFTQSAYVPALIGKTFEFEIPMKYSHTIYDITIYIVDGSGTQTVNRFLDVEYGEARLEELCWHRGTFPTRAESLDHHFENHGAEIAAPNIVHYLVRAGMCRDEVLKAIEEDTVYRDYNVSVSLQGTLGHKYKHKYTKYYIILADSNTHILSFGR